VAVPGKLVMPDVVVLSSGTTAFKRGDLGNLTCGNSFKSTMFVSSAVSSTPHCALRPFGVGKET